MLIICYGPYVNKYLMVCLTMSKFVTGLHCFNEWNYLIFGQFAGNRIQDVWQDANFKLSLSCIKTVFSIHVNVLMYKRVGISTSMGTRKDNFS